MKDIEIIYKSIIDIPQFEDKLAENIFSAINKIFERIEIGLLFEITSCAIDISWIIASLSNVNFI